MRAFAFPANLLWDVATAAHQVEGNTLNSESWLLEHLPGTIYAAPSGNACDHYHRYCADIAMPAGLGFNTYRFPIEWAHIEPKPGKFSTVKLEHYRRMLAAAINCRNLPPFHHAPLADAPGQLAERTHS